MALWLKSAKKSSPDGLASVEMAALATLALLSAAFCFVQVALGLSPGCTETWAKTRRQAR